MPPPVVKCWKCGETVGKSTTVCTGKDKDGLPMRCCKSHQEACLSEEFQKKEKQKELDKLAKEKQLAKESESRHNQWHMPPQSPHCWVCERKGIFMREVYFRLLKESLRAEMEGRSPMEIFDGTLPERVAKSLKEEGLVVLFVLPEMSAEKMTPFWRSKTMPESSKQAMQILRSVCICGECARELGVEIEPPKTKNNPTPEQLLRIGQVMETSGLNEAIRQEIRISN